jgi:hypothetical protein
MDSQPPIPMGFQETKRDKSPEILLLQSVIMYGIIYLVSDGTTFLSQTAHFE